MRDKKYVYPNKKWAFAAFVALPLLLTGPSIQAEGFTAGRVVQSMKPEERYPFVAGVIEGLAYARYRQDGKQTAGMTCIYDWFYKDKKSWGQITQAFLKFKDHTPGAVLGALLRKECG